MTELSAQMMAARGAALQTDVDAALALKADQTALDAVAAVADAAVTPAELTSALAPYAQSLDLFNTVSATSYAVQASDQGKVIRFTAATAISVTLPGSLGTGFNCLWRQVGAGQITFAPAGGQTMRSYSGVTKSAGQYAEGALAVDSSGDWYLSGTTA